MSSDIPRVKQGSKGRAFIRFFTAVLILLLLTALMFFVIFWFVLDKPSDASSSGNIEIRVPRGVYFSSIAYELEDSGLISNARYAALRYKVMVRLGMLEPLQAGRFLLTPDMKPSEIIKALTSPSDSQRVYTSLTFPPGLTVPEMARIIENSGLALAADFENAALSLAADYPVESTSEGLQGYLFPDTYKIELPPEESISSSAETAKMLVRIMADEFFKRLDQIDSAWEGLTPSQLHEKVTLASIVEREYRVEREAPLIAAVFNNRITKRMPLESCATVVYTIENTPEGARFKDEYIKFNRRIFEHYLDIPSGFNTYRNYGLTPSPICSPGKTALSAAFFPAESDALFFVVKDPHAGTHVFSKNYSDHLNAREAYLKQFVVKE